MHFRLFNFLSDPMPFLSLFLFYRQEIEDSGRLSGLAKIIEQVMAGVWHYLINSQWKKCQPGSQAMCVSVHLLPLIPWVTLSPICKFWLPCIQGYLRMNWGQAFKKFLNRNKVPHGVKSDYRVSFPYPQEPTDGLLFICKSNTPTKVSYAYKSIWAFLLLHKISSWKSALILSIAQAFLWIIYFEK